MMRGREPTPISRTRTAFWCALVIESRISLVFTDRTLTRSTEFIDETIATVGGLRFAVGFPPTIGVRRRNCDYFVMRSRVDRFPWAPATGPVSQVFINIATHLGTRREMPVRRGILSSIR
jgi:hypothetical protein